MVIKEIGVCLRYGSKVKYNTPHLTYPVREKNFICKEWNYCFQFSMFLCTIKLIQIKYLMWKFIFEFMIFIVCISNYFCKNCVLEHIEQFVYAFYEGIWSVKCHTLGVNNIFKYLPLETLHVDVNKCQFIDWKRFKWYKPLFASLSD